MNAILRRLEITFDDGGHVRGARAEYVKLAADGADVSLGTKREPGALALLPAEARSVAEFAALTAENDQLKADAKAADDAKLAAANEALDLSGQVDQLRAQIAAMEAAAAETAAVPAVASASIHIAWFRAALADLGLLAAVDDLMSSRPVIEQELWAYATAIDITRPDVVAVATALEIDLDAVFARAVEIRDSETLPA